MRLLTFERCSHGSGPRGGQPEHSMSDLGLGFEDFESTMPGSRRLGALIQLGPNAGAVVDLNRALAVKLVGEDVGAPEAEADSLLPSDMLAFLRGGARSLEAAHAAFAFATAALERYDAPDLRRAGVVEARGQVRLCAPLPRPSKIVGVARNYLAHATERGDAAPPQEPVLFLKAPSAVIGPEDEIVLPLASRQVDYGGELAVVIGRPARDVLPEEALEYVAGYCAANDVTAMNDHTKSVLLNKQVIAVNQDPLGVPGWRIKKIDKIEVWKRPLKNGDIAVAFVNLDDKPRAIDVTWAQLNVRGQREVTDLWKQRSLGKHDTLLRFEAIPSHGVVFVRLAK